MQIRYVAGGLAITMAVVSLLHFGRFQGAEEAMQKQAAYAARLNTLEVASK
jgi:hypothetical protein